MMRPYRHHWLEVFFMRTLFALAVYFSLEYFLVPKENHKPQNPREFAEVIWDGLTQATPEKDGAPAVIKLRQKEKVGIGHFIDLKWLTTEAAAAATLQILLIALIFYALGIGLPIATTVVFWIHNAVFTLNNSMGATHHGYQIITLILLAQMLTVWGYVIGRAIQKSKFAMEAWINPCLAGSAPSGGQSLDSWFVYYSQLTIGLAYVLAGVAKPLRSHINWIIDCPDICVEMVKTNLQKYYEYLEGSLDIPASALWIAENPDLTRVLLTAGLVLELIGFMVLINRTWALLLGISFIALHKMIESMMNLHFEQNIDCSLIFLVNIPFWLAWPILFVFRKRSALPSGAGAQAS